MSIKFENTEIRLLLTVWKNVYVREIVLSNFGIVKAFKCNVSDPALVCIFTSKAQRIIMRCPKPFNPPTYFVVRIHRLKSSPLSIAQVMDFGCHTAAVNRVGAQVLFIRFAQWIG